MKWTNSYRSFGLKTKRSTGLKTIEHKHRSWRSRCRSLANIRGRDAGGVCRFLLRTHPTDERSLTSCLCIKELIDGSNGLSWHPYAFVWRFSEGVRGNLRAGPTGIRCDALAIRRLGLLRTKTKKNCAEHTRGTTPWALRPSPPAHHPPPATRLREAKTFPNHIAARVAP